jgi:hypothetical protein
MSQQINLYDPIFLKKEKHFSARTIAQALGVMAVALVAFYVYALVQTRAAERGVGELGNQVAAQRDQLVQLTPKLSPEGRSRALEAEVARLEAEVAARQTMLALLGTGQLGNTTGFSEFLAALGRQAVPGVWLTGLSIGESGNDFQVHGRALRPELVPAYLQALNSEPMMRGRQVTEMKLAAKSAPPRQFVEFTVTAPQRLADTAPAAKGAAR